jgi:hypothetical protein
MAALAALPASLDSVLKEAAAEAGGGRGDVVFVGPDGARLPAHRGRLQRCSMHSSGPRATGSVMIRGAGLRGAQRCCVCGRVPIFVGGS